MGVLGTFVWDTIVHPDRPEVLEQWGGLAYCVSAFSGACPPGWEVVPIAKVGRDLEHEARAFLSTLDFPVRTASIVVVDEPNNRVVLRYRDRAERSERLTGGVPGWTADELDGILPRLDALYVNHMSGLEMDLPTALALRARFSGPIYSDLHSLFLEIPRDRPRRPRRLPEWEGWLRSAEVIQMNEAEIALVGPATASPFRPHDLVREGTTTVFVTRGRAGAEYAVGEGAWTTADATDPYPGGIVSGTVPLIADSLTGDPTGCGDVWGSIAFVGLLEGRPVEEAMSRAHVAAAARLRHGRIDGLDRAIRSALRAYDASR